MKNIYNLGFDFYIEMVDPHNFKIVLVDMRDIVKVIRGEEFTDYHNTFPMFQATVMQPDSLYSPYDKAIPDLNDGDIVADNGSNLAVAVDNKLWYIGYDETTVIFKRLIDGKNMRGRVLAL